MHKPHLLITGGSSGIGAYLIEQLSAQYTITTLSRTKPAHPHVHRYPIDLSDQNQRMQWIQTQKNQNIFFDGCIMNAGVGFFGDFTDMHDTDITTMLQTNLHAPIDICKYIIPHLPPDGVMIYIGSRASRQFMKHGAVYQASKFGLRGFAGALHKEYPKLRIHFLNPKIVDTNFFRHTKLPIKHDFAQTPLADIAQTCIHILNHQEIRFEIDL